MSATTGYETVEVESDAGRLWWVFLVAGIAWVVLSFMVLSFDPTTPATIGVLTAFVLIAAGVNEIVEAWFSEGWKWLHAALGILYVIAGIMALLSPFQTFGILALLIGWYLLFKGTFDLVFSIAARHVLPMWGLALAAGIVEIALGVWAIGYPGRSAALLVLWIGTAALIRGVTDIVTAFQVRRDRAVI